MSELLAVNIRANPLIKGLSLPGVSEPLLPISQYADDTSLVVCSDTAICAVLQTYYLYERGSGLKLNMSKSKGLWLGSWSGRLNPPVVLVVQDSSVGGFYVVDVKLKVQSMLVLWVKRYVTSSSSWSAFLSFWFHSVFNSSPVDVFSRPFAFSPRALPPFISLCFWLGVLWMAPFRHPVWPW